MSKTLLHRRKSFRAGGSDIVNPADAGSGPTAWFDSVLEVVGVTNTPPNDEETMADWNDSSANNNDPDIIFETGTHTYETSLTPDAIMGVFNSTGFVGWETTIFSSSTCDVFFVIDLNQAGTEDRVQFIVTDDGSFIGRMDNGVTGNGPDDVGTPTYFIDGASADGTSQDSLFDDINTGAAGTIQVVAIRGCDLTGSGIVGCKFLGGANATYAFFGAVYEIIAYDEALSTADYEGVYNYLGDKYSVTITHP